MLRQFSKLNQKSHVLSFVPPGEAVDKTSKTQQQESCYNRFGCPYNAQQ